MNNYFVDTHCHVFKSDYENIDEVLENASNNHINILLIMEVIMKLIKKY